MNLGYADLTMMAETDRLSVSRTSFPDGEDLVYVAVLLDPRPIDFALINEYVPSHALLYDAAYEGRVVTLTFEARQ